MEKLTILIVDDEEGIRTGIRRVLRNFTVSFPFYEHDFEYDLIDAETGEQAIQIIDNQNIDIILLDNKLPGIEGIEVLEYINNKLTDCAVMMITSYASMDLAIKATNNGAFNFIPKPFSQQDLKSAIESITKHLFLKRMTQKMKLEAKNIRFKFLSVLSHELKSPINAVEGYLRIMQDKQAGTDISAYENMIERSIDRLKGMRNLIMDMLDLTKIESGKKNRELKNIDIVEIANMCLDSIEPMAIQKNLKIIKEFPKKLKINADSGEIEIIFNNLLSNAVKYNKKDGQIKFYLKNENEKVIFIIEDSGIGMTEEEKSSLFEDFKRIKNEKTKNISGSGLGLSIMKKIIDLNKGNVKIESKVDIGSKFTVEIPV
ncbi:MAG: hybrid sensor histidine kinase/response regulator [Bacteroidales bacterium]|nr:hybrid sensor histidine kinase/response regulator [Bacteroidales bacterium]MBN2755770.1 hybrid sensor histidine kinase/response regulator [Bacteroidales bacterium]